MPEPLTAVFGIAGFAWGLLADRIAARWPAHDDDSVRALDWRTPVVAVIGAAALGLLPGRFDDGRQLVLFAVYVVALVLLLATDLDQRLLPDWITLPLIPAVAIVAVAGLDPYVAHELPLAVVAAVAIPLALFVLSIPFGAGAIGIGDLKLLVSVGLLVGLGRAVGSIFVGALLSGVTIGVLLAARRITLRSYIPFGPFLIVGAIWAILLRV